ncbi:hypothetical protein BTUL_0051g00200 [Botrytis tulipae]|uniref:Uncharacterized protein n=1 Tax=Botrytis tulipae TaxID=87230 RepID=A0A4Z1EQS9_9HELO|nr:hypothetical protein BTUL_0051g00200 [Botrytis tulipae]
MAAQTQAGKGDFQRNQAKVLDTTEGYLKKAQGGCDGTKGASRGRPTQEGHADDMEYKAMEPGTHACEQQGKGLN